MGSLAERAKEYASEVGDKITEGYDEMRAKLKAYIGPIEEAEEFTVDNQFIIKGYRINHSSCKTVCKSLFTCHNEFVNVWSHIGGVLLFLILLVVLCATVLPAQFQYAREFNTEFAAQGNGANPETFINQKISDLDSLQASASLSAMGTSDFEDSLKEIMYQIEGISNFYIEQFYTFDYLQS